MSCQLESTGTRFFFFSKTTDEDRERYAQCLANSANLQTEMASVKADISTLQTQLASVTSDVTNLKTQGALSLNHIIELQANVTQLMTTDVEAVQLQLDE